MPLWECNSFPYRRDIDYFLIGYSSTWLVGTVQGNIKIVSIAIDNEFYTRRNDLTHERIV